MTLERALARLERLLRGADRVAPASILVMLAGSNGAGKSTFHESYLAELGLPFVNADVIAAELRAGSRAAPTQLASLPADQAAQRLADEERQASIVLGRSFVTETVRSDPVGAKVAMLRDARARGFEVWLFFIGISSAALSRARVRERVASRAGHDVPDRRIEARYPRTLANLPGAIAAASVAVLLDNDSAEEPYRFVALFRDGALTRRSRFSPKWASRACSLCMLQRLPTASAAPASRNGGQPRRRRLSAASTPQRAIAASAARSAGRCMVARGLSPEEPRE
jgi:predicted ABC-type ATPase